MILGVIRALIIGEDYFNDKYIKKELPPPEASQKEVEYIQNVTSKVNLEISIVGGITEDKIHKIQRMVASDLGLRLDFEPNPNLTKYAKYLSVIESKIPVDEHLINEAKAAVSKFPSVYVEGTTPAGPEDIKEILPEATLKDYLYLASSTPYVHSFIKGLHFKNVLLQIERKFVGRLNVIEDTVDLLIFKKEGVEVVNFYYVDNVTDFPELYESEGLNYKVGLQNWALDGYNVKSFVFAVVDNYGRYVNFKIKTPMSATEMSDHIDKIANYNDKAKLPYEFQNAIYYEL